MTTVAIMLALCVSNHAYGYDGDKAPAHKSGSSLFGFADKDGDWRRGADSSRRETVRLLEEAAICPRDAGPERQRVCDLRRDFSARAGRQQIFLDGGSSLGALGTVGSMFSAGAGAVTQGLWFAGALLPVAAAQFNAYDPTRSLFQGGVVGLDLVLQRYMALSKGISALDSLRDDTAGLRDKCDALYDQSVTVASQMPEGAAKTALLPEMRRVYTECQKQIADYEYINFSTETLKRAQLDFEYNLATDATNLEAVIGSSETRLRAKPEQTVSSLVGLPLQALNSFVLGQDGKQAIDKLKTQEILGNLNIQLQAVSVPYATATDRNRIELNLDALLSAQGRASAPADAAGSAKTKPAKTAAANAPFNAGPAVLALRDAANEINKHKPRVAFLSTLLAAVAEVAAHDTLQMRYDATRQQLSVALATSASAATPPAAKTA